MKKGHILGVVVAGGLLSFQPHAISQVVINEFQYDDTGTADDREFVELFNSGSAAVNIGGWSIGGRDNAGQNTWINIPADTSIAPGGYYVIGNANLLNVNQVAAGGFLENDAEQVELWDGASGTGNLIDGVVYEGNKGSGTSSGQYGTLSAGMLTQVGGAVYWGNHQATDVNATAPLTTTVSIGRYIDGLDRNNNGRDFGMRPATPGTANNPGIITKFTIPKVDALADGTVIPGVAGSFVGARVITPGIVVAGMNPNAISAPPSATKALIAWDGSGGGNGVTSANVFNGKGGFDMLVYLDTVHIGINSNATNVKFTGSEQTMFGLGGGDALANLADLSGKAGLSAATTSANGASGVMWYYEKVGESAEGLDDVSQKLYLVDAGDGGNGNADSATFDWTVLATIDLAAAPSAWHRLALDVNADGSGTALFDDQAFTFNTTADLVGSLFVTYRENAQLGSVGVPEFLRPPTVADVPEPSTVALGALGGLALLAWRRRS